MIKGYVGVYGSGKTLWLAKDAQWFFKRDLPVISNTPIWGYNSKGKKVTAKYIWNDQIHSLLADTLFQDKPTLLIIDEASNVFDSYNYKRIPIEVWDMLKQSRKVKLHIYYTSQRHADIATRIRENTSVIYMCDTLLWKNIYRATGVSPFYFQDKAKSNEVKQYILKRRFAFKFSMAGVFKHYMTQFVVTSKETYKRFADKLGGDPETITPESIEALSKQVNEVEPPV